MSEATTELRDPRDGHAKGVPPSPPAEAPAADVATSSGISRIGLLLALAVAGLVAWLYQPVFLPPATKEFASQGEEFFFEASQSNGLPVLVLAAWLFYRKSHYRDLLVGQSALAASAVVLTATLGLYGWATYTNAPDLKIVSAVPLLGGAALLAGGRPALRAFGLPIAFLLFALPLPPVLLSAVIFPIQLFMAEFAGVVLNGLGVESFVQGDQILRPENTFIVIETCSGVRTVVTLLMLAVLMIDLFERRGRHATILFLLTPFIALLTNGLRVVTLVLNPHSSIHSVHNLQGIAMLLVGLTGVYLLDGLLERLLGSRDPDAEAGDYGLANALPVSEATQIGRMVALAAVVLALIGLEQGLPRWTHQRGIAERPTDLLARVFGEGASVEIRPDLQFTGSIRHLDHARRRFELGGQPVDVHLGVADEQERRFTMLSPRLAWPESGHAVVEEGDARLRPNGKSVRRMVFRRGTRTLLAYSWYERRGGLLEEAWRQAAALDRSPFVRPEHMLAIRISTPIERGEAGVRAAEARVLEAWERLEPELAGYAPTRFATEPQRPSAGRAPDDEPAPPADAVPET